MYNNIKNIIRYVRGCSSKKKIMEELFKYKIKKRKVRIIKYLGSNKDVVIPKEIAGFPVIRIHDHAYENNKLTNIDLTGVKSIGIWAFYNNKLTNVNFSGIKIIYGYAFVKNNLTSINLSGVKHISNRAFENYVTKYVNTMQKLYIKKLYKNSRKHKLIAVAVS